jgi:4-aminobutyrate--pyruvate transaminase
MSELSNAQRRAVETVVHGFTNLRHLPKTGPIVVERGKGVYVWDTSGKRYLEGMAGLWCTALGYGNEEMAETAREQVSKLSFAHLFAARSHDPGVALAEKIKELSPAPASHVFFGCSGSEANDSQIKLTWYYNNARGKPEKKKIIGRQMGYHGVTLASASLTGIPRNHIDFDLPLDRFLHVSCPSPYRGAEEGESEEDFATRLAEELNNTIQQEGPDTVAAFFAEPAIAAGGVHIPPRTYFDKIQPVLERYDVRLIADEVVCGFGRTGEWFGSQTYGIKPDSISIAKQLTSAYAPLSAITVPGYLNDALEAESEKIGMFAHGYTYMGHPLSAALALKALEIYERDDIVGHVKRVAPGFQEKVRALGDHPLVGDARGVGLMGGLELVADKATKRPFAAGLGMGLRVVRACEDEGLILRAIGDVVAVCPPQIITEQQIDELFEMLTKALDRVEAEVAREDLRAA